VIFLAGSVAVGLFGCAQNRDKLAYDNFTQIRTQTHSREDVEAILGEPDQRLDDRFMYERPDQHLHVFVEFDDKGRVTRTQWIDGLGETWHDTDDAKPHKTPGG
jgi:hypothetical protein